jgi:hypothetical protein
MGQGSIPWECWRMRLIPESPNGSSPFTAVVLGAPCVTAQHAPEGTQPVRPLALSLAVSSSSIDDEA